MPYQLIYTSAAKLLDSPLSGYGVVARSETMPAALVRLLIELSEFKEPAEQGICGPQFSYRVEECHNTLYHIFTSVRPAGADYSKRSCHIAHHLALRTEEMHALCRGATPPTPAGILLSLELRRYWVHRWQQEPEYIADSTMPPLWESPAASNFPTWLIFTGSGENACAFQTPPFHQGCLVTVPQKTQARDILRLLHESYSLSPTLGWGISFCTYSVEDDSLESNCRLFTVVNSALYLRAQRMGFPILELRPGFKLPPPPSAASMPAPAPAASHFGAYAAMQPLPPSALAAPAPPQQPAAVAAAPLPLSALPTAQEYVYVEDRSNDTFESPWHTEKRPFPTLQLVYGGCALAIICAALWAFIPSGKTSHPAPPATHRVPQASPAEAPATENVHPQPTTNKPEQPTPEPAQATTTSPQEPEEPQPAEPEPPAPVEPSIPEEPPTPEEPPASNTAADDAELPAPTVQEATASPLKAGKTYALIVGEQLPNALLDILPEKTGEAVRLVYGDYCVHVGEEEDGQVSYKKGKNQYIIKDMNPGKGYVLLDRVRDDACEIIASDSSIPRVTLQLDGHTLAGITVQGSKDVALQLPVPDDKAQKLHRILLLPQMRIRLHPAATQPAAEKPEKNTITTPEFDKSLIEWDRSSEQFRGELSAKAFRKAENDRADKEHKQSWARSIEQRVELSSAPSLLLPQVLPTAGSEIRITPISGAANITCKMSVKKPMLYHVYKPATELCRRFNDYLNRPREIPRTKPSSQPRRARTMAQALRLAMDMSKAGTPQEEYMRSYGSLYQIPELARELRVVYADHIDITYSDVPDSANVREWIDETKRVRNALGRLENRKALLKDMENYLTRKLEELLQELRREFANEHNHIPDYALQLKSAQVSKGQLIWTFELEQLD